MINTRVSRIAPSHTQNVKARASRNVRHAVFTMKRPLVFQVRKSLVEYVDDEMAKMETSVFYQRIFILAKNVEPKRESALGSRGGSHSSNTTAPAPVDGDTATLRTAEPIMDEDQHYSQVPTPEGSEGKDLEEEGKMTVKIVAPVDGERETVTRTFRFDEEENAHEEQEMEDSDVDAEPMAQKKDIFAQFIERLHELQMKCRDLAYTPDPMCGLVVYMNEYTMMMLESGEDMMGIFCRELLAIIPAYWQSCRVFHIEDNIKELYTKELVFRRIPAAYLNEKFPPSTPTDEYLMGKQHLIIKDKMFTICTLIGDSLETNKEKESSHLGSITMQDTQSEAEGERESLTEEDNVQPVSLTQIQRLTVAGSEVLPVEIFRKLLPEIQRIELVLASQRFYYTLEEFCALYGKVPIRPDDDGCFWPIQNNYTPPNIFRRTPFDINLTFAEYAAEMQRRQQEDKDKAEQEAAAEAEEHAAEAAEPAAKQPTHKEKAEEEPNE